MKLERVEVQGFRSFRDHEAFDFTAQPGVVRLGGRNDDEPRLGANGAGKTSLWEAVYWALYGKTSTGLRGPEVATWQAGRGIYVLVRIDGRTLVRTTGSKNTLTLDGEDATPEQVAQWVGLSAEQFLHCTYMAQHASTFLDLTPQAKTDLLASVLDLDRWNDLASKTSGLVLNAAEDLEALRASLHQAQGALEELASIDYRALFDKAAKELRDRAREASDEVTVAATKLKDAHDVEGLADDEAQARRRLREVEADILDIERRRMKYKDSLDTLRETLRRAKEAGPGNCPMCGQSWPHKHVRPESTAHTQERIEYNEQTLDGIRKELERAKDKAERARTAWEKAQAALANEKAAHQRCEQDLDDARRRLRAALSAPNPYADLAEQQETRLRALRERVASLQDEEQVLVPHVEHLRHWSKAFRDVRLYLVAEAMQQLEVEVNSSLVHLGLHDWSVRFAPDGETKSGDIKRGFSVFISSPTNPRPVPWAVWSGGEAQRLRLAATMGLSNLIASYTGYQPFIEVWDEPSNGMGVEGIEDMLRAFEHRAMRERRQVWVVDHRALDSGVFTQTVLAVKASGTTKLERIDHGSGE